MIRKNSQLHYIKGFTSGLKRKTEEGVQDCNKDKIPGSNDNTSTCLQAIQLRENR
jgi:hypothetical protein